MLGLIAVLFVFIVVLFLRVRSLEARLESLVAPCAGVASSSSGTSQHTQQLIPGGECLAGDAARFERLVEQQASAVAMALEQARVALLRLAAGPQG